MKDVTIHEIIKEIERDFPIKVPRFVISQIVRTALKKLYKQLSKPNREFRLHGTYISRIYEITDGKEVLGEAMDLDETKTSYSSSLVPVRRMDLYDIRHHTAPNGNKEKTITVFKRNSRRSRNIS